VASEKGTCDYENYSPTFTYLPSAPYPYSYLAYSSYYDRPGPPYGSYLWFGAASSTGGDVYWESDIYSGLYVSSEGVATHSKGLLEWSLHTFEYDSYYPIAAGASWTCFPYGGYGLSYNSGGAYTQTSSIDCYGRHYDLWSFVGPETGYVDLSVDTVSATTTFDAHMILMDDAMCYMGQADDSFDCTYPPTHFGCPSYRLPTEKGSAYFVLVNAWGNCASPIGEYVLSIDAPRDPGLSIVNADAPYWDGRSVTAAGSAIVP
jgi:hypothetical protein